MLKDVLRANIRLNFPAGLRKAGSTGLANFVSARPPAGPYSRLRKYAGQMKNKPTLAEKRLFSLLKVNNITFYPQKVILPYIVDCLIPQKKLVVELDGKPHTEDINQLTYDTNRDALLMSLGVVVVRFDNDKFSPDVFLKIFKIRPNCNSQKILSLIGQHNKRYEEKGFNRFSIKYFRKLFRNYLWKELGRVLTNKEVLIN